jgi:hypothetical protein
VAYAAWRAWNARVQASGSNVRWENAPFPFPPEPRPATPSAPARAAKPSPAPWVDANGDGTCPATHPIKAKVKSGIYHEPGGGNYDRTKPDRCYVDAATAEADGLRRSKV